MPEIICTEYILTVALFIALTRNYILSTFCQYFISNCFLLSLISKVDYEAYVEKDHAHGLNSFPACDIRKYFQKMVSAHCLIYILGAQKTSVSFMFIFVVILLLDEREIRLIFLFILYKIILHFHFVAVIHGTIF